MKFQNTVATLTVFAGFSIASPSVPLPRRENPKITVINNCKYPIYAQLNPGYQNYNSPDPLTTLKPGEKSIRDQAVQDSLFVAKTPARESFVDLSLSSLSTGWALEYGLALHNGDAFLDEHVTLMPSNGNCGNFNCKPGDRDCYVSPGTFKTQLCQRPVSVELILCASTVFPGLAFTNWVNQK